MDAAAAKLEAENGRPATPDEIAGELGISRDEYDEYEKERIEEDQAECEQIEAEMEAEVEAKYEDFLDAQKYDPSLRA